jgi:cytochrome c
MHRCSAIILASTLLNSGLALSNVALAQKAPFGSAAEAKAMEERVITELKSNETVALTKFNKADGEFRDRDLYVFCFNATTGIFNAHAFPALMGTDNRLPKEKDGSPLGQKIFDAVNAAKEGTIVTVSYNFPKPNTTEPLPKESYVARVGNTACGVGYYK